MTTNRHALQAIVDNADWQEAKSYRDSAPHEYVVRGKNISITDFAALANAIRDHGYTARWRSVKGKNPGRIYRSKYLVVGEWRLWWITTVINRAPIDAETDMQREDRLAAEANE